MSYVMAYPSSYKINYNSTTIQQLVVIVKTRDNILFVFKLAY